jgi:hypothetical protein
VPFNSPSRNTEPPFSFSPVFPSNSKTTRELSLDARAREQVILRSMRTIISVVIFLGIEKPVIIFFISISQPFLKDVMLTS